jgi:UDP-glucose 4-epimerase
MFKDKLMEVDCLLHLAALVKDSKDVTCDAKQIIENNIFGTINILKVLPRLKHIFFSSTCSVYGKITKSDHRQVNEFHSTNPEGLYALSKLICEKLLKMYCEDNKIKLCILRISSVYSPFDYLRNSKRAIQIFAENIKGGKDIVIFGNGQNKRDYIFLEDAVDGIIWSMNTLREGIYNISSGKAVSINKIAKMLLGISGKDINIFHEKNSSQDDVCCYSSKKALNEGFLLKYNLRSGLKRVYESTG